MKLAIDQEALKVMIDHAGQTFPNECCGFFYGREIDGKREITRAQPVRNSKKGDQSRRFEIDPLDYFKAEKYAEKNDITLLGIFHSHPNHPAKPSEHDRKQAVPFFSYIIISIMNGKFDDISSWQLNDKGNFDKEEILNEHLTI